MSWPPVPISDGATGHGSSQSCSRAGVVKNLWVWTCHLWNFDLDTNNVRTLTNESTLVMILKELESLNWDSISKVWRNREEFLELKNSYIFSYKGQKGTKEHGFGLLVNKELAWNIENFCSVNERVASLIIELNNRQTENHTSMCTNISLPWRGDGKVLWCRSIIGIAQNTVFFHNRWL